MLKKHITPCTVVITSLLVREKPLGAPPSVKRVYGRQFYIMAVQWIVQCPRGAGMVGFPVAFLIRMVSITHWLKFFLQKIGIKICFPHLCSNIGVEMIKSFQRPDKGGRNGGAYVITFISMAWRKTAVTPLLTHWTYCTLALSYRYRVPSPGQWPLENGYYFHWLWVHSALQFWLSFSYPW